MATERDGEKLRVEYTRYDFVRGNHKRIVRVLDVGEAFANNALYQHLKGKRRNDDRRS